MQKIQSGRTKTKTILRSTSPIALLNKLTAKLTKMKSKWVASGSAASTVCRRASKLARSVGAFQTGMGKAYICPQSGLWWVRTRWPQGGRNGRKGRKGFKFARVARVARVGTTARDARDERVAGTGVRVVATEPRDSDESAKVG